MTTTPELIEQVDKWEDTYRPITNHFGDKGWNGILFETYLEELEFVKSHPDNHIWTWVDGEDGTYIVTGMVWCNRIGYFVTEVPWTEHTDIAVDIYG